MDALLSTFHQSFYNEPQVIVRAPGRVNLIGGHVDYNDGFVLPIAIDREVRIAASACNSPLASISAIDFDQAATFRITELKPNSVSGWIAYPTSRTADGTQTSSDAGWAAYPAGVAWSLQEAGCELNGIDAVIASNVPIGAGLSSSAAVEVAFAKAWEHTSGFTLRRPELARLCQRAENEYVGVQCGIMDQMISAMGRSGHAMLLDCRDLSTQHIPLPKNYTIIIADTKVKRALASSAYNERRQQCDEAVRILRKRDPSIRALRDVTPEFLAQYNDDLPKTIRMRAQHVVDENVRVLEAVEALQRDDVKRFGQMMIASHASLRDNYEVSCHELDAMVDAALEIDGLVGARLTGAGFGGCIVCVVRNDAVERFVNDVPAAYRRATGIDAEIVMCRAADGASTLNV